MLPQLGYTQEMELTEGRTHIITTSSLHPPVFGKHSKVYFNFALILTPSILLDAQIESSFSLIWLEIFTLYLFSGLSQVVCLVRLTGWE